ncbi:hypothetical protein RD1_1253 [Roseobacter denitrificans OCh 114]|uniref:EamA domain-containing protein n=2 Tax=Roseobacter denitrificans TaxID=2434 RepID=Q16AU3_ROSDO|nr:hypothetical protein RD1_1253 [Roseobacter denitrificans OCh 114]
MRADCLVFGATHRRKPHGFYASGIAHRSLAIYVNWFTSIQPFLCHTQKQGIPPAFRKGHFMTQLAFGYGFIIFTALIVIIGDSIIKVAADAGHAISSSYVVIGVVLYGVSAVLWFFAMQHITLVQAAVAYSMLTLVALAIIGALWFNEPLHLREYAGLACALLAMVLMSRIA